MGVISKSIAQICRRLSLQCTKTINACLWSQMDCVTIDCNLKKVRLTVFKFLRCDFQNALEQVMSCSFSRIQLTDFFFLMF